MSKEALRLIDFRDNMMEGFEQLPEALQWVNLGTLDLSNNMLKGPLLVPSLEVFDYRVSSNLLTGEIPSSFCGMSDGHVLDFSNNNMPGTIPPCFGNLSSLLVLDLKGNKFSGNILRTYREGNNLRMIDLSQNLLEGNKLSGEIPAQLELLNFLAALSLSYNNLSGLVPKGKQFDTFENDSYVGTSTHCGEPLSRRCGDRGTTPPLTIEEGDDSEFLSGVDWVVICLELGSGIVVGFIS
ncbi:hypothetical protein LguiB_005812 [Lonicera macranthoides]